MLKNSKGISLIALVITIILLLILSGVTIATLTGNGLFEKAKQAKQDYIDAQNTENSMLNEYIKEIDGIPGSNGNGNNSGNNTNTSGNTIDFWGEKINVPFQGEGTKENPYKITNATGLAFVSMFVSYGEDFQGKYFEILNDINLNENNYTVNIETKEVTFSSNARQWTPIGNSTNTFKGVFDGKNHTIKGVYISSTSSEQGLFGVNEGIIRNINLEEGYVAGSKHVGAICGQNSENSIIEKCYSKITVIASDVHAGGICGRNEGTVQESWSESNVTATAGYAGGICGLNMNTVKYCYNLGKIVAGKNSSSNTYGGGIVGYNLSPGVIQYTYNMGTISKTGGTDYLGGIVGQSNAGKLYDSYSSTLSKVIGRNYSVAGTTTKAKIIAESEMRQESFIDLIGGDEYWKFDESNQRVILSWQ